MSALSGGRTLRCSQEGWVGSSAGSAPASGAMATTLANRMLPEVSASARKRQADPGTPPLTPTECLPSEQKNTLRSAPRVKATLHGITSRLSRFTSLPSLMGKGRSVKGSSPTGSEPWSPRGHLLATEPSESKSFTWMMLTNLLTASFACCAAEMAVMAWLPAVMVFPAVASLSILTALVVLSPDLARELALPPMRNAIRCRFGSGSMGAINLERLASHARHVNKGRPSHQAPAK
mmetsp:Transcript_6264/g.15871  ORF Transcript_6264/g.15871 Transcript_6264/m.15871 type:complete len:235 (-) Transcript_6264:1943-2647(-)